MNAPITLEHNPFVVDKTNKQVIYGTIPSKSNGYKIITLKPKDRHPFSSLGKTKELQAYEKSFFLQCNKYRNKNIETFFSLEVDAYYPNNRSDLDGMFKILLDCLQKNGAIKNDNLCVRIIANKFIDKIAPRIEFELKEV